MNVSEKEMNNVVGGGGELIADEGLFTGNCGSFVNITCPEPCDFHSIPVDECSSYTCVTRACGNTGATAPSVC